MRFDPTSAGTKTATVTIRNNDPDGGEDPYTFRIQGTGLGFPEIAVSGLPDIFGDGVAIVDGDTSPRTADGTHFGTVDALAFDQRRTFRIRNSGTAPLTVSASDGSSPHWNFAGVSPSISAGNFDDFDVIFNPQQSGTLSATITLTNNDANENPYTFVVRGTARAPEIAVAGGPGLNINIPDGDPTPNTTDHTDFTSIDVLGGPIDRTFRIRNTQSSDGIPFTGDLVISSVTENSSQFSIVSAPLLGIGEGGFDQFVVRYDPTSIGTHTAIVTIRNNDPDGGEDPYTFTVRGVGTGAPEIAVFGFPSPISDGIAISDGDPTPRTADGTDFGEHDALANAKRHTFRIKNSGSLTLTVDVDHPGNDWGIAGTPTSVPAQSTRDFDILFNPRSSGTKTVTFTINNNDSNEDPYTFALRGVGRAPEIAVAGGAALDVNIANGDNTISSVEGTDFGSADILTGMVDHTFRISNTQSSDGIPFTGDLVGSVSVFSSQFEIVSGQNFAIGEGSSAEFVVRFDPDSRTTHTGVVTINHNDPDDDEDPYTFVVRGVGVGSAEIEIFGLPNLISDGVLIPDGDTTPQPADCTDFGADVDALAPPRIHTFRVKNVGSNVLRIDGTASSEPEFEILQMPDAVGSEGLGDFMISFNPSRSGLHTAIITITNNDPDGGEGVYTFEVQGAGRAPEIVVTGGPPGNVFISHNFSTPNVEAGTDFGTVEAGDDPVDHVFLIKNVQNSDLIPFTGDLVVDSLSVDSPHFSILTGVPIGIGEEGEAPFTVRFAPAVAGTHTAVVSIDHNDPDGDENPFTFTVRGIATGTPEIAVFGLPTPITEVAIGDGDSTPRFEDGTDFGTVDALQADVRHNFRVRNIGTDVLTISSATSTEPYFRIEGMPATVPAGGSADFEIIFDPGENGLQAAEIRILSDDPDGGEGEYAFQVWGRAHAPAMEVRGGPALDRAILNGDLFPSLDDGTDFDTTLLRIPVEKTFRIMNIGPPGSNNFTRDLFMSDIRVNGDSEFRMLGGVPNGEGTPVSRPPGGSLDFTVRFRPTQNGVFSATVTIRSNDPNDDPYTFPIQGSAINHPPSGPIEAEFSLSGRGGSVSFPTDLGRLYRLTSSTDLTIFTPILGLTGIAGTGGVVELVLSGLPTSPGPSLFFRVEEE